MKKKIYYYLLLFILFISMVFIFTLFDFKEIEFTDVYAEFWVSNDNGKTYVNGDFFELPEPGNPVHLKLRIQAHTNKNKAIYPQVSLSISDSEHIDARIVGGPTITPRGVLSANIIYDFTIRAEKNNKEFFEVYMEFMPHSEDKIDIYWEIDGVSDNYNRKGTLILREKSSDINIYYGKRPD